MIVMKNNLEKRLAEFAAMIISLADNMKDGYASTQLLHQIIRSGSSAALNFGEAKYAQSRKDFIHKISIVAKELNETNINLMIIEKSSLVHKQEILRELQRENGELLAIMTKTLKTLRRNNGEKNGE
jgi:four helix bundle protein